MDAVGNSQALVATPEYASAMERLFRDAVHDRMAALDPIYGQLRRVPFPEGVRQITVEASGSTTTSPEVHISEGVEVSRDDIVHGNIERFHEVVNQVAESFLPQFMRPFFEHVGEAAESVGNSIDLGGQPLNWDAVLDAYEMTEWIEDDAGTVQAPQLVMHPNTFEKFAKLPSPTAEQQARSREIAQKKQEAHVSRRRSRRLRRESD